jgi:pimeloyl-ACP methyl ester carboxylesterase
MGASIGWFYASVCPSQVERIIAIDQIKPLTSKDAREAAESYGASLTTYLEAEKKYKNPQQSFRFETALEILTAAHDNFGIKLNREGALCLIKRATKTAPDGSGLNFTRDARLNALLGHKVDAQTLREFYSKMTCEMLIILGKDGINDLTNPDIKCVYDGHAETAKNFKCVTIEGDHFVHLTDPEKVANIITDYVLSSDLTKRVSDLNV